MIFTKTEHTFTAIQELVGGGVSGLSDGTAVTYHDGQTPPTQAEIDAELVRMQEEWDTQEYARNRQAEYPSIQECVHAILDDDLDALQAKRAETKLKYPKGG